MAQKKPEIQFSTHKVSFSGQKSARCATAVFFTAQNPPLPLLRSANTWLSSYEENQVGLCSSVRWILRPNQFKPIRTHLLRLLFLLDSEPAAYPVRLWRTLAYIPVPFNSWYRYYIYGTLRDGRASTRYSTMSGSRAPAGSIQISPGGWQMNKKRWFSVKSI